MGRGRDDDAVGGNNVGKGLVSVIKQVLVTTFGFTKTGFVLVLQGSSQNLSTKTFCFGFFLSHEPKHSHRRSETKIAKTSLTGTKPTYDEIKKKEKKFR
jgi:hypothetical protein